MLDARTRTGDEATSQSGAGQLIQAVPHAKRHSTMNVSRSSRRSAPNTERRQVTSNRSSALRLDADLMLWVPDRVPIRVVNAEAATKLTVDAG